MDSIKEAGIKIWMLTGDHIETAINIGYSSEIIEEDMLVFKLDYPTKDKLKSSLQQYIEDLKK